MNHRLEVYVDSYSNLPIVQEMDETVSINIGDEITVEDWLKLLTDENSVLELNVKVADVRHLFWDTEEFLHSVSIRVVPVE